MSLKPGYSGLQRPGDEENMVRFQKKWGGKRKWDVFTPKKIEKWGVKSQKMKETRIRETRPPVALGSSPELFALSARQAEGL